MDDPVTHWVKPDELDRHRALRAERGFSEFDWWNFSEYLTWVIVQGLEKFKDGAGFPAEFSDMDEWRAVLDEIIEGFVANRVLYEDGPPDGQTYDEWRAPLQEKWEKGAALFVRFYGGLWD